MSEKLKNPDRKEFSFYISYASKQTEVRAMLRERNGSSDPKKRYVTLAGLSGLEALHTMSEGNNGKRILQIPYPTQLDKHMIYLKNIKPQIVASLKIILRSNYNSNSFAVEPVIQWKSRGDKERTPNKIWFHQIFLEAWYEAFPPIVSDLGPRVRDRGA